MEEHAGRLWHRLVTRAASRRHPGAAVRLAEFGKTAAIFFRALGGDGALDVRPAAARRHGARRGLIARLAGSGEHAELAWRDEAVLALPEVLDLFPERALNRDLYLWLIALAALEKSDGDWFAGSQRATRAVFARFPGMEARYRRLVEPAIALRPALRTLPFDEMAREDAIRAALRDPGSVAELPSANRAPWPVALWLDPQPPVAPAGDDTRHDSTGNTGRRNAGDDKRRHAERVDMPENKNPFLLFFRAESLLTWAEYVKVNRASEEDEDPDGAPADDLEVLSVAQDGETTASSVRFDLDLPSAALDDIPLGEGIRYPEWHYRKGVFLPEHCRVQPMEARQAPPAALPERLSQTARRMRRQFEALAPARVWVKGQTDGAEPDLDACVRFFTERAAGTLAAERGLYRDARARERDLASLLLADLSLSTDAHANDTQRVIDVIRDSLFLFAEALSATGDRFGLYGFSSLKRQEVRFHTLKEFGETYGAAARGRIAAIRPGYYTRMGAALRHASQLLARQSAGRRLLLLLTDGKPNDLDHYEGRYGLEDTRMALIEARRRGLHPFCVTIDARASDYLPHLFGPSGYVVIRKPAELARELPLLYAQLTR
jgi:nitric oxide reductase NorD protein